MIKRVLTIAGSDCGGGAGIQADLKTFHAFGVFGMSVITAVTAQNTVRVNGVEGISPEFVALQFESVMADIGVDAVKTGMMYSTEIVLTVAEKLRQSRIPYIVVDPVMVSTSENSLLESKAVEAVIQSLLPNATLVTPNIPEASEISDMPIHSPDDMKNAAIKIQGMGCRAVLITGGHLKEKAQDILFDGQKFFVYESEKIDTLNTHGSGCTISAAITANLALGRSLQESIKISKRYVNRAIQHGFSLGKGHGPLNHFVRTDDM
jgi:hydroxymethylpyrimidine/phosphomethylpyrimidine kinase